MRLEQSRDVIIGKGRIIDLVRRKRDCATNVLVFAAWFRMCALACSCESQSCSERTLVVASAGHALARLLMCHSSRRRGECRGAVPGGGRAHQNAPCGAKA